ncbi:hypothetical protein GGX14DRAFT_566846 [Mycena pura]|uniref:Uncharacterized protein n=1 Tax=Mycena pura TaxID=153505 RepID=A0AAD6Y9H5_9AGAR|nr:hypothetical protein GGX14DRAFT_566846 [Mycena pura]
MTWATAEVKEILVANGSEYFEKKGADRDSFVEKIVTLLKAVQDNLDQNTASKVKTWYNNEIARFRTAPATKVVNTVVKIKCHTAKSVARELHTDQYVALKAKETAEGTGWAEIHRVVMGKLWEELSEEEKEKCKEIAVRRNSGDVTDLEKRQLAAADADQEIAAFVKKIHSVYGVRMLCLASWTDPAGKAQTSVHETSATPKFSQQFPKWKTQKGIVNAFLEYSELFEDIADNGDSGAEEAEKTSQAKYPWAVLDFFTDTEDAGEWRNYPLLPEAPKTLGEWIGGAKMMIRAFVNAVYKLQTGSATAPWGAMATPEGARHLISDKYLPEGLGLKDPSRMVKTEVQAYYKLWMGRQKDDKKPLVFKLEEAKQKAQEDREARSAALQTKKRSYVEIDDGENEDNGSESEGSGQKKQPSSGASGDEPTTPQEDHSHKAKKSKSTQKPLKPAARAAFLRGLSAYKPYILLIESVLNKSTTKSSSAKGAKLPVWASWDLDCAKMGLEFFDMDNNEGYLPNWGAVLAWMEGNPHLASEKLSHIQASNILLIVGWTLRTCRASAEAEEGHPLHEAHFEVTDSVVIEEMVAKMAAAVSSSKD